MKLHAQPVTWAHPSWSDPKTRSTNAKAITVDLPVGDDFVVSPPRSDNSLAEPLRVVGILAFCQVAFFAVLFLLFCARAGAATETKPQFSGELKLSEYNPKQQRDPFGSGVAQSNGAAGKEEPQPIVPVTLKLQGILYHAVHPSALVNDQLIELKKPVLLHTGQGDLEVQALEITREIVLLEVAGQKVELRLGSRSREKTTK